MDRQGQSDWTSQSDRTVLGLGAVVAGLSAAMARAMAEISERAAALTDADRERLKPLLSNQYQSKIPTDFAVLERRCAPARARVPSAASLS